ncbi:MAG: bifunctional diaminohydroxyphosphoribosylaminopyrimidine deaminase/5-amino-6-(5-phosphoribosylamino)uracil reductase RibD [Calditrichia bacterium]
MSVSDQDILYINRAIDLAANGKGQTSPNPMVGCVIVKDGHVIGEGYHQKFGQKHAEIEAIDNASASVEGATLYCNLEPCCNGIPNKKTPPCTNRIISEKIKKVVIANPDPNPYVNGKGIRELKQAGIEVVVGVESHKAGILNEAYFKYMRTKTPFVHVKIAQSLDGSIATHTGDSKYITNHSALELVHEIRYEVDGILVGLQTIIQDNPFLTQRLRPGKQPYRIILDEKLKIPLDAHVVTDDYVDRTIIITTPAHSKKNRKILEQSGITILEVDATPAKEVDIYQALTKLGEIPITHLLVEGGSRIFTNFIKEKLVDKLTLFVAPKIIGNGIPSIGDLGIDRLEEAIQYRTEHVKVVDGQIMWTLYPEK